MAPKKKVAKKKAATKAPVNKRGNRMGDLPTLKAPAVRQHLDANYESFTEFYKKLRISDAIITLLSNSLPFETIENPSEALCRWRDTQSIPYHLATVEQKQLKHLISEKATKAPAPLPQTADVPDELESIPFLNSKTFNYTLGLKTNNYLDGMNIRPYVESLVDGESAALETSKETLGNGVAMFCGGSISALTICPRADKSDRQILAVSTFAEEVNFFLPDSPSTYVQLWAFSSDLESEAECICMLEVQRSTVIAMEWCPVLVDHPDERLQSKTSKAQQKATGDCLGLLAVATNKGVVFIYNIPRQLSDMRNPASGEPFVFRTTPVATLVHSHDYSVNHCIPIGTLKWAFYDGGVRLFSVSDAGGIMVWNLAETEPVDFVDTEEAMPHMRGISKVYEPFTSFYDANWDAPPIDACWIDEEHVAVLLRSRIVHLYSWPDMESILVDEKPRSYGLSLVQAPALFDGCFSLDITSAVHQGVAYTSGNYMSFSAEDNEISQTPIFNRHQLQIFDGAVSSRSGILSTVGGDGRIFQSMNARVKSRRDKDNQRIFHYGKSIFHLLRWKRESDKENFPPVSLKHEECRQNTWLELRAGDAALLEQSTIRKHFHIANECLLDRRTESLTRISASILTDGLVAAGGEAGLVFLMPTII